MFLDLNGVQRDPDPPDVDDSEAAMLAIAAGQVDETWVADWLRHQAAFPAPPSAKDDHRGQAGRTSGPR
ncbi:MAG: hypothetical protein ACP5P1_14895 [Acidimicrobiales bacterium]